MKASSYTYIDIGSVDRGTDSKALCGLAAPSRHGSVWGTAYDAMLLSESLSWENCGGDRARNFTLNRHELRYR